MNSILMQLEILVHACGLLTYYVIGCSLIVINIDMCITIALVFTNPLKVLQEEADQE